jgi:hypothetical protein
VVAHDLDRDFIGGDIDAKEIETSRRRLGV